MFTDMVGYSALAQRDDKLALELLEEHRRLLREIFPHFHGTEIKTIGDAFLVEFGSALEAAQCAIEIQRSGTMFTRSRYRVVVGSLLVQIVTQVSRQQGHNLKAHLDRKPYFWESGIYENNP